jgi:RHS repeat-associated protein
MKQFLLFLTVQLSISMGIKAQNISSYQYWYDGDYNSQVNIYAGSVSVLDLQTTIDAQNLSVGLHDITIRFQDSEGKWSVPVREFFYISTAMAGYEYWFDSDFQNRIYNNAEGQEVIIFLNDIPTTGLDETLHVFNFRAKDLNGKWSSVTSSYFMIKSLLVGYEYWFDDAYQDAVFVSIEPSTLLDLDTQLLSQNISNGEHVLHFRALNSFNRWSSVVSTNFNQNYIPCSGCTEWTNAPISGSDACVATGYLCSQDYIIPNQNGTTNHENAIKRQDLSVIVYRALFNQANPTSITDHFPTPFTDMQASNMQNTYWRNAATNLCYLEYGDGKSPFSREFINFNPQNPIKRKNAFKVLMEAFDVSPVFTGVNPFNDVPETDPMYGYLKAAFDKGIIIQATFEPEDYLTREDAFIFLYRILMSSNVVKPTIETLANEENYFIPGNHTPENISNIPDIDQGNFNHYQKTSFSLTGRGLSLDFTHSYNSYATELPDAFFTSEVEPNQHFMPLGKGWTHNFNHFIQYVSGYSFEENGVTIEMNPKYLIYWADGSAQIYDATLNQYDTKGVYDTFTKDENHIYITTKNQITYTFFKPTAFDFYFPTSVEDRNHNRLQYHYTTGTTTPAILSSVEDVSTQRSIVFTYQTVNGKDYIHTVQETGLNRIITFQIDTNGDLISYSDAKGQQSLYSYYSEAGSEHLLHQIQLPKGNIITNTYEQRKLRSTSTNTNAIEVEWQNQYGTQQGQATSTVTDEEGRATHYNYNSDGNPIDIISPTSSLTDISYGSELNEFKPESMNVMGQNVVMDYDERGNLLYISKNGINQTFTYTLYNDLDSQTDANGNITDYNYDSLGNLIEIIRPTGGGSVLIDRNDYGQVEKITSPSGMETQLGFDLNGNVNSISLPLGISTSAEYDNASRLIEKIDANGHSLAYTYDANDHISTETNALGDTTHYEYDLNDNLIEIENADGESTLLNFSFAEDWLESQVFGGIEKSYTYYPNGSLHTMTKGTGTFTYTYDPDGRVISDGQSSYTYDSRNNVETITNSNGTIHLYYDIHNRLDSYDDYFGNTVDYEYDPNGNVLSIKYPGNKIVAYTYDNLNRMTEVEDWNQQVTSYEYILDDKIERINYPNNTYIKYEYDAAGRLIFIRNKRNDGSIISEYGFTLDTQGNHLTETLNDSFTLAALASLLEENTSYSEMPYNQIQSLQSSISGDMTFSHDLAGNVTSIGEEQFAFDINDNLISVTGGFSPATYTYDGSSNRRTKTTSDSNIRYVLDILGMSMVLMETDDNNAPLNYYIYGANGLISNVKPNGDTYYYHYDYRGSATSLTNDAGTITHHYTYDPYGKIITSEETFFNPYRYNGAFGVQYDSSNRYFMRARYYNPNLGRFISEDPVWHTNLYPFADNNPVMYIDPLGNDSTSGSDVIETASWAKFFTDFGLSSIPGVPIISEAASLTVDVTIAVADAANSTDSSEAVEKVVSASVGTAVQVATTSMGPGGVVLGKTAEMVTSDVLTIAQSDNVFDAVNDLNENGSDLWKATQKVGQVFEKVAEYEVNKVVKVVKKTKRVIKKIKKKNKKEE